LQNCLEADSMTSSSSLLTYCQLTGYDSALQQCHKTTVFVLRAF